MCGVKEKDSTDQLVLLFPSSDALRRLSRVKAMDNCRNVLLLWYGFLRTEYEKYAFFRSWIPNLSNFLQSLSLVLFCMISFLLFKRLCVKIEFDL